MVRRACPIRPLPQRRMAPPTHRRERL
jgi:hypothetical protein